MPIAAAVQMTSTEDAEANLRRAFGLLEEAVARGAEVVALPENFYYLQSDRKKPIPVLTVGSEPVRSLCAFAKENKIHLLAGTIPEEIHDSKKMYNTSMLIMPDGEITAAYRKIHLFDVNIPDGAVHEESKYIEPGNEVTVAETGLGKVGLTVCYDLRFPELYRRLALAGARVIFVPSAFTAHTGKDHWKVLLRARAIENQVFIVAPGQFGAHSGTRESYGHSMIVDPWGTVLAEAPDEECVVAAEVDFRRQDEVREQLPCLEHVRKEIFNLKDK